MNSLDSIKPQTNREKKPNKSPQFQQSIEAYSTHIAFKKNCHNDENESIKKSVKI